MPSRLRAAASLIALIGLAGCEKPSAKEAAKPASPAKVEKVPGEADLTTVTLTPEAETRLKVATVPVERKDVPRARTLGGEVVVPPGRAIVVSAPLGGTLLAPDDGVPAPGTRVRKGQVVFRLLPMLSPEAQATMANALVDAMGAVEQAEKQLAQAKIMLDRAERLYHDNLGGQGALTDAQAQYDIANSTLQAAMARRDALDKTIAGIEGGTLDPLPIQAEADGSIKGVHVLPGQAVAAGALLFDIEELDPIWVRVPVYVGDRRVLDLKADSQVGNLVASPDDPEKVAKPVDAPPSGDPLAATVHLFYEVPNADHTFWPGQRVGVTVPLRGQAEGLVVPRDAILYDYHGGTWVYVKAAPQTYDRRRVRVDYQAGDIAVLLEGPEPGAEVVTTGAAELFGTEFGGGK
jgi:RND family efflux transporter MFP subunit